MHSDRLLARGYSGTSCQGAEDETDTTSAPALLVFGFLVPFKKEKKAVVTVFKFSFFWGNACPGFLEASYVDFLVFHQVDGFFTGLGGQSCDVLRVKC